MKIKEGDVKYQKTFPRPVYKWTGLWTSNLTEKLYIFIWFKSEMSPEIELEIKISARHSQFDRKPCNMWQLPWQRWHQLWWKTLLDRIMRSSFSNDQTERNFYAETKKRWNHSKKYNVIKGYFIIVLHKQISSLLHPSVQKQLIIRVDF